jgi:photosystem II stability/assembly factor-like uncharacterized protein
MKTYTKQLLLAILFLIVTTSFSQTVTWTKKLPASWTGSFSFVEWFQGNGLLAIANNGYFYKSLDTGMTWTTYPQAIDTVVNVLMYPDHKQAFIYSGTQVYKTIDAAISWQKFPLQGVPSDLNIGYIYRKTDDTLIIGGYRNLIGEFLYMSSNKGQTWVKIFNSLQTFHIRISGFYFTSSKHGYCIGDASYYETFDGGMSWLETIINTNGFGFETTLLEIPGKNAALISYGFPKGLDTIKNANLYTSSIQNQIDGLIQVDTMLYAVGESSTPGAFLFSSSDYGVSWIPHLIRNNWSFNAITFLDKQTIVIVGPFLTSYCSKDGGKTWNKYVYEGAEGFNSVYPKSNDECYLLGTGGRLYHSTNGGQSWNFQDIDTISLQNMQFPTKDTGYISLNNKILQTIDAGLHWRSFPTGNNGDNMHFVSKDIGYVGASGTWGEFYESKTTDGGQTWNIIWGDTAYDNMIGQGGSTFRLNGEGLINGSKGLLFTADGGDSWQSKDIGMGASGIYDANNGNWIVTVHNKIYLCDKSINCKLTYSDPKVTAFLNLLIPDSNYIAFQDYDSLLISKDGGNTWKNEYFPSPGGFFVYENPKTVYTLSNNCLYKGIIQTPTTLSLTQTGNRTVSCTVVTNPPSSFPASIVLMKNDSVFYQSSVTIQTGSAFIITLPESIAAGTGYIIKIIPTDTISYAPAQSSVFSITTGAPIISNSPVVRVVDKSIVCDCTNFTVYNYLGQKMYPTNLPIGFYFVKVGNSVQKVIIKE